MNLILEKTEQVEFFTNILDVFMGLRIECRDYDWYVSDIKTNGHVVKDGWYSGKELEEVVTGKEIQFIWAVFSAVPKNTRFEVPEEPYVEGNPDYWNGSNPKPQLTGALFEIACWDSSATILVGINDSMANSFRSRYPDTKVLEQAG